MFATPLLKKSLFGAVALGSSAACYQSYQKKSLGARSSSVLAFGGDAGATGVSGISFSVSPLESPWIFIAH